MLLTFKKVIQSYTTPPGVALSRHLTTHLSHQISYINLARPLSVSQGNSIRWLKKLISALDPDLAESEAKRFLCEAIDQFIREKITLADEVIAREAGERIVDEDIILTFGKSSVVERTLLAAHKAGRKFRVIIIDSRPLFEGKNLARSLVRAGLQVQYSLLSALGDVVEDATKCILGAAAMLGNGRMSSRAGAAMVAMMAKSSASKIPVIVLCETYKFTGKVALDSIVMNELGEGDALIEQREVEVFTSSAPPAAATEKQGKGGKKGKEEEDQEEKKVKTGLEGWRDQPNLYLLNLMYDITPAEYLDVVISELGSLPPSAVPVVNGVQGGDE
jgi:translation initiation factor eIF-2B subunit delta